MLPFIVTDDLPLHIRFRFATKERKASSRNTPQISGHVQTPTTTMYTHTDIAKLESFNPPSLPGILLSVTLVIRLSRQLTSFHGTKLQLYGAFKVYQTSLPFENWPMGNYELSCW